MDFEHCNLETATWAMVVTVRPAPGRGCFCKKSRSSAALKRWSFRRASSAYNAPANQLEHLHSHFLRFS
ncbi:hypothetical protein AAFF_G00175620 [Aldrovandia affinis]|uniref:Uncharacterized protein n=1 Tax=Aldrovandia affinis TaxID=143900 RepID=A0AAD7RLP3_9TELE|nr:hypothetical protein AAFF_G00175620 [Aldrovandia affinis]